MQILNTKFLSRTLLISALLLPFFLLSSKLLPWSQNIFVQSLVYPFEYAWFWSKKGVTETIESYIALHRASEENMALRKDMEALKVRVLDYQEKTLEIDRLRELLDFSKQSEKRSVIAEVVDTSTNLTFSAVRISRGKRHGIKSGMPTLTSQGVVGKVIRTESYFSDVQLITDPNFSLDVVLQRTRVRGVLRGFSDGKCLLQLERGAEIRIGDTIVSSGIIGAFPKGLPVGHVVKITYASENVAQIITVEPWVDHRRVEEVTVLLREDPELQKITDTAGGEPWIDNTLERDHAGG